MEKIQKKSQNLISLIKINKKWIKITIIKKNIINSIKKMNKF